METVQPPPPTKSLRDVQVRLVRAGEEARFLELLREHHYLGCKWVPGSSVWHVAERGGIWVALVVWASAAMKCGERDRMIGWIPQLRWQRLIHVANNVRFLVLPEGRQPHLASRVLGLSVRRLGRDWENSHRHKLAMVETFVDPERFRGTCYRAAGWMELGRTSGYGKSGKKWVEHGRVKQVFVKPLHRDWQRLLADPMPDPAFHQGMRRMKLNEAQAEGLKAALREIPEHRESQGRRHDGVSILSSALMALLCGAASYEGIAEWVEDCDQRMLERLDCRFSQRKNRFEPPSEPTIRRYLQSVDAQAVDDALGRWLLSLARTDERVLSLDGKWLKGSAGEDGKQVKLLSAFLHKEGMVIAQRAIPEGGNEITEVIPLLEPLPLKDAVVSADALHTQTKLAEFLTKEKEAHYLFTAKGNQPGIETAIRTLDLPEAFPPSGEDR